MWKEQKGFEISKKKPLIFSWNYIELKIHLAISQVFWHFKDVIKIVWFFQYHFSKWAKWLVYQCFDKEKMLPSIYFVGPFVKLYLILTKDLLLGSLSGQKSQKLRKTVLWPNVTSPKLTFWICLPILGFVFLKIHWIRCKHWL